jgi:hypothetical protein
MGAEYVTTPDEATTATVLRLLDAAVRSESAGTL